MVVCCKSLFVVVCCLSLVIVCCLSLFVFFCCLWFVVVCYLSLFVICRCLSFVVVCHLSLFVICHCLSFVVVCCWSLVIVWGLGVGDLFSLTQAWKWFISKFKSKQNAKYSLKRYSFNCVKKNSIELLIQKNLRDNIKLKLCAKRVLTGKEWFWFWNNFNGTRDTPPLSWQMPFLVSIFF